MCLLPAEEGLKKLWGRPAGAKKAPANDLIVWRVRYLGDVSLRRPGEIETRARTDHTFCYRLKNSALFFLLYFMTGRPICDRIDTRTNPGGSSLPCLYAIPQTEDSANPVQR